VRFRRSVHVRTAIRRIKDHAVAYRGDGLRWLYEHQQTLQALKHQAAESLSLRNSNVVAEIERYRYLPVVLAQDERIHRLLDAADDQTLVEVASEQELRQKLIESRPVAGVM
jgi:C4-dicarboxylate-specific signal transduction histidine kinase